MERAEIQTRESLVRKEAELRELAVIEHLIGERERWRPLRSPPPHILAELGDRASR